ncbi:MAG TPA: hypothetical protein VFQ53_16675 [Kofleriaceae bacterium]|nr:hypothetical protein [Kofleriaceae bacterium]
MLRGALLVICVLAACGKPAPDCDTVGDRIATLQELPPAPPGSSIEDHARFVREVRTATEQAVVRTCRAKAWSRDTRRCAVEAAASGETEHCLDAHERMAMTAELVAAMRGIDQDIQLDSRPARVQLEALRDATCACHDAACVQPLATAFVAWTRVSKHARHDPTVSAELDRIGEQLFACQQAAVR